jgi:PspA associated protein B
MGLLDTILGRTKPVPSNLDALFGLPSAWITLQSAAGMTCSGRAGVCYKPPTGQGFEDMEAEVVKLLDMDGSTLRKVADSFGYQWVVLEDADVEALVTQVHMVNSSLADAGWGPQLLCSVFGLSRLSGDGGGTPGDTGGDSAGTGGGGAVVAPSEATGAASAPSDAGTAGASGPDPSVTAMSATDSGLPETTVGPGVVRPSSAYLVYLFKRGTFYPFVPVGPEKRDTEQELRLRGLVSDDLDVEPDLDRWFPLWELPVG